MYFSSVSSVLHLCQQKTPQVMFLNLIFVFSNIHYIYCGWRRLVCCFASVLVDTGSSKRSLYFHSIAPHQLVCAGISYCLSCLLRYKCVWGCLACFMSLYDVSFCGHCQDPSGNNGVLSYLMSIQNGLPQIYRLRFTFLRWDVLQLRYHYVEIYIFTNPRSVTMCLT